MQLRNLFTHYNNKAGGKKWSKEHIAQGLVGDVGDLMKIIMAKAGLRTINGVDKKLAHELSDCLWSILVLAQLYNVDLEKSFMTTMDEVEKNLHKKLSTKQK